MTTQPHLPYMLDPSEEWARVKRDLEDDLAPRLYSQILRAPDENAAAGARAALAEVRLIIDQLGAADAAITDTLSQWHAQAENLCEPGQIALHWHQPPRLPAHMLSTQSQGNPLRILREVFTNAFAHAHPTYMEVAIELKMPEIVLTIAHDGVDHAPDTWEKGRGLLNIEARAKQLSGEVRWNQQEQGKVTMRARLILEITP